MKEQFKDAIFSTLVIQNKESFEHTWKKIEPLLDEIFQAGMYWGETYSTWFIPTKEDTKKQFNKAIGKEVSHE